MAIHFYYGGTDGKQDGTLISNGDLTSPLVADGFYPASGVTLSKTIPIQIRADAGETWQAVSIAFVSDTEDIYNGNADKSLVSIPTDDNSNIWSYCAGMENCFIAGGVHDTNKTFNIQIRANGDGTNSPDTSIKIITTGGIKCV